MNSSLKLSPVIYKYLLSITSAVLLTLSYPKADLEFFAWFAFIPFFFAIKDKSRTETLRYGFLFGLVFFSLTIYWLTYVSFLGYIVLILYLALYFSFFAFFVQPMICNSRFIYVLFIPLVWILLEYMRTYLFSGFGWALLGYSQYLNLPIIQIADKTGVWGVSFIIMMFNVAVFKLLKEGLVKTKSTILITILLLAISLIYGHFCLKDEIPSRNLLVSVIQGNIPQEQKWDERFKDSILARYETLTKKAAKKGTDLIIWPETALPGYLEEKDLREWVTKLARNINIPLLIGTPSTSSYSDVKSYNSAALISENGILLKRYDKLHLVPFGEYVPFEKISDFARTIINKPMGNFSPGDDYTIFELKDGTKFGVLICFEDIFPQLVRSFAKNKPDFMVNITNDAWFLKSSAPYQHAQASVFRAIENRIPVIRAANTGLSCFINAKGFITDRVVVDEKDIFVTGFKTSKVHILKK